MVILIRAYVFFFGFHGGLSRPIVVILHNTVMCVNGEFSDLYQCRDRFFTGLWNEMQIVVGIIITMRIMFEPDDEKDNTLVNDIVQIHDLYNIWINNNGQYETLLGGTYLRFICKETVNKHNISRISVKII